MPLRWRRRKADRHTTVRSFELTLDGAVFARVQESSRNDSLWFWYCTLRNTAGDPGEFDDVKAEAVRFVKANPTLPPLARSA